MDPITRMQLRHTDLEERERSLLSELNAARNRPELFAEIEAELREVQDELDNLESAMPVTALW